MHGTGYSVQVVSVKANRHSGTAIPAVNFGAGTCRNETGWSQ
ncbi:hypothetical protein [Tessaracoccus lacteus]|uniref:Uncharacterized protein n=1 Tax=Tessaracoccus lacteus TaxID=3041766 RepID=A0ABY8PUQ6_9ACTN|nr:hypothetical protein [Tessaracoccus sp. T21]WGT46177.1 hypothetical protein QH948_08355 [Tessaracoccus sp. T21]